MMHSKAICLALLLFVGVLLSFLTGCVAKTYAVTCDNPFLIGLGEYRAGAKVEVVMEMWATDTDYAFFVDGADAEDVTFDYARGYIIRFTMPKHDVHVTYTATNSMAYAG